jgi:hypothetical protein
VRSPVSIAALAVALATAGAVAAGGFGAHALTARMTAKQVVGPSGKAWVVPASLSAASGSLSATLSADGRRLSWRIAYAGLGSPRLVIADVHVGAAGRFGPDLVRLCGPCASGQRGVSRLTAAAAQKLVRDRDFVTLITDRYPNGVVRGQLLVK